MSENNVRPVDHLIRGMCLATSKLVELMAKGKPGDSHTADELKAACGKDTGPKGKGYPNLQSAIRHVERNYALVWRREHGTGRLVCLDDTGKMSIGRQSREAINRKSKRATRVLQTVKRENLGAPLRSEYDAMATLHATLSLFSSTNTAKQLEGKTEPKTPDIQRLLEAFK